MILDIAFFRSRLLRGVPAWTRWVRRSSLVAVIVSAVGCHGLLDVNDPTVIQDKDLANATAANARRLNVVGTFSDYIPNAAFEGAVLSDEYTYDTYSPQPGGFAWDLDLRDPSYFLAGQDYAQQIFNFAGTVGASSLAIRSMRTYGADSVKDEYLAQLFALRANVFIQLAEDMCSGFPVDDIAEDNSPILNPPFTYDSAMIYSVTQLDSALAHGRDSTRFINFAKVLKGRALLDLGQYAQAAAAVQGVPTSFSYTTDPLSSYGNYWLSPGAPSYAVYGAAVGDREGGNGLPFVSAHDPRVTTTFLFMRLYKSARLRIVSKSIQATPAPCSYGRTAS